MRMDGINKVASPRMVSRVLFHQSCEEWHFRIIVDVPSWRELSNGMASTSQDYEGHSAAR